MARKSQIIQEVHNTHEQLIAWKRAGLEKRPVAIGPGYIPGRRSTRSGWNVYSPWEQTDPGAPWYHRGQKHFSDWDGTGTNTREKRKSALIMAMQWANEKYGPFVWQRNRMGEYVPAPLNDKFPIQKHER